MHPLSSRLGLIQLLLLRPLRKPTRRREGERRAQRVERLVEQPLERSPVTQGQGLQSERRRVQSGVVASKKKLTSRRNNKHNNRDRPNSSKDWILFGGHFQPA